MPRKPLDGVNMRSRRELSALAKVWVILNITI